MTNDGTAAAGILEEETVDECQVCRTRIVESPNRYDYYYAECHDNRMLHASDAGEYA